MAAPVSCASRKRCLCGVEPEAEILFAEGGVKIRWLVPKQVPSAANLGAPLVFADTHRGGQILKSILNRYSSYVAQLKPDNPRHAVIKEQHIMFGSGYFPEPGGCSFPCCARRAAT